MRYLIITYVRKATGQIDEQVTVAKNIKDRDIQMASVIMDYKTKAVVKCVIDGQAIPTDWDKLNEYYKGLYPAVIARLEAEANQE